MSKMAIVSGGGGFLGARLARNLLDSGYTVAAIGRREYSDLPQARRDSLSGALYIAADLADPLSLERSLQQAGFEGADLDYVFHLAWAGSTRLSDLDVAAQSANVSSSVSFYELSGRLGAERFVFAGTMEEAFALAYTRLDHTLDTKYNRHVLYALAKMAAADALKVAYDATKPDLLFAVNSHLMGRDDEKDSFLQVALRTFMRGEELVMSTGEQNFDVIHIDDCARAYRAIAERGRNGQSYWVGSGEAQSLRSFVEQMHSKYPDVTIRFGELPYNDVRLELTTFDISSLVQDTGFKPEVSFLEAVDDLEASFLELEN